jgi:nitrate reductase gamma subunit
MADLIISAEILGILTVLALALIEYRRELRERERRDKFFGR